METVPWNQCLPCCPRLRRPLTRSSRSCCSSPAPLPAPSAPAYIVEPGRSRSPPCTRRAPPRAVSSRSLTGRHPTVEGHDPLPFVVSEDTATEEASDPTSSIVSTRAALARGSRPLSVPVTGDESPMVVRGGRSRSRSSPTLVRVLRTDPGFRSPPDSTLVSKGDRPFSLVVPCASSRWTSPTRGHGELGHLAWPRARLGVRGRSGDSSSSDPLMWGRSDGDPGLFRPTSATHDSFLKERVAPRRLGSLRPASHAARELSVHADELASVIPGIA